MIPTTFRLKPPPFACTPAGSLRSGPHLCRGGEFCKHPPHLCRRLETFRPGVAARMSRPSPQIRRSSASTSPPAPPGRTRHEGQFRVHRREAPVGNRLDLSPAGHAARPQGPRHQTEVGRGWIEILDKGMLLTLRGKAGWRGGGRPRLLRRHLPGPRRRAPRHGKGQGCLTGPPAASGFKRLPRLKNARLDERSVLRA